MENIFIEKYNRSNQNFENLIFSLQNVDFKSTNVVKKNMTVHGLNQSECKKVER